MNIKSGKKNKAQQYNTILKVKMWIFWKKLFNISFCRINNLSFYLNKNKLGRNC